jgi:hypothetical protein
MATAAATRTPTPWHLWVVGALSLLWNALGGLDYVMTKTHNAKYLSAFTAEQKAWFDGFPLWMNCAWAIGVWFAILGSLLLLLRSRFAVHAFIVSLAGLVVSTVYQYGVGAMPESLKTNGGMGFTAVLSIVAGLLVWYAMRQRAAGVLR